MAGDGGKKAQTTAASLALKKSLRFFMAMAVLAGLLSVGISQLFSEDVAVRAQESAQETLMALWKSYKHYYIQDGRVVRPKNDYDTVSEGQAYAMLRAVWHGDRETFDAVYRWSEENLSRLADHGDHLLSWRYGQDNMGGRTILDANPALDADLDYALALFLAAGRWGDGRSPLNTMGYRQKALAVADSIMNRAVYLHPDGQLVLLPWPMTGNRDPDRDILVNPSYFSPGHYRIFERESGNRRWGKLASDTYRQLSRLLAVDAGGDRVVTVPDWILMRPDGGFAADPTRGYVSGWDAYRLWWRLRLDYEITGNARARELIENRLIPFINKSMADSGGDAVAESDRDGKPLVRHSNAGMAAVYNWTLRSFSPALSRTMHRQALRKLQRSGEYMFFEGADDYYTNSWAWFAMLEGDAAWPFVRLGGGDTEREEPR